MYRKKIEAVSKPLYIIINHEPPGPVLKNHQVWDGSDSHQNDTAFFIITLYFITFKMS
jgi:hypothetical protein